MQRLSKYKNYLLLLATVLFLTSFPVQFLEQQYSQPQAVMESIKHDLKKSTGDYYNLLKDTALLKGLINHTYSAKDLNKIKRKPYVLLLCINEQLTFWSDNKAVPSCNELINYANGSSFVALKNGYYHVIKKEMELEKNGVDDDAKLSENELEIGEEEENKNILTIVGLELLKYNYEAPNKYLSNETSPELSIPNEVVISDKLDDENIDIAPVELLGDEGKTKLYISYDKNSIDSKISYLAITLQAISIILILFLFYHIATVIADEKKKPFQGFLLLITSFILLRFFCDYWGIPLHLDRLALFSSERYTSIYIHDSLGDLFINSFLFFVVITFFYRKLPLDLTIKQVSQQKYLLFILLVSVLFILAWTVFSLIKALLTKFGVSFAINRLIYLDISTVIGLLTLLLIMASFYFICRRIAVLINQLHFSLFARLLGSILVLLPYSMVFVFENIELQHTLVIVWMLVFISIIPWFAYNSSSDVDFRNLFGWIFFFAGLATTLLYSFEYEKTQNLEEEYANKVSIREDRLTEFLFTDIATKIIFDPIIKRYYVNPLLQEKEMENRIKKHYLTGHFDKYDTKVRGFYGYNANKDILGKGRGESAPQGGVPLTQRGQEKEKEIRLSTYDTKIKYSAINTKNNYLYLIPNKLTGSYSYLAKLPVFSEAATPLGYLIIEMTHRTDRQTNVYPELTIPDDYRLPEELSEYSYAIYKDGNLESYSGDYAYNYRIDSIFINKSADTDYYSVSKNKYTHLAYYANNSQTVLISKPKSELFTFFALLSYLFILSGLIVSLSILFYSLFNTEKSKRGFIRDFFYSSLRQRINITILSITLLSFFIIGLVTTGYFYTRSTSHHDERLKQKQREILISLEGALSEGKKEEEVTKLDKSTMREELLLIANSLSEIHSMDLNLYDLSGELLASSQQSIFEKSLISNQMDTEAFFQLSRRSRSEFIQDEYIGKMTYLAAYVPIANEIGKIIGYLNLPYFGKQKELQNEISAFLVTLISVYLGILILAVAITLSVANSITNPLRMISEKLKEMKLDRNNEHLYWQYNDEIGTLIQQYNKMIIELDKSAKELKKTERKAAWEQMARQVAHEIKNPLTPMKLSIQHLQRAYNDDADNLDNLMDRVAKTLINQIDALSRIASEFSAYAKMPEPINDTIDLNEIVLNAASLYEETESIHMVKLIPKDESYIYADKNQLIRVFNNLVKNAIQAIPYDRDGSIVVKIMRGEEVVTVTVRDNGSGIGEEQRDKVFVPNFTTKSSGMGLGLAMSKNIVEAARGQIWFESVVDEGTTFYVELPLLKVDEYVHEEYVFN